ncbi:MAG: HdeD family acid-resistance protein [Bulleidia sp.]
MFKNLKWDSVLKALIYLAAGIVMLVYPEIMTTYSADILAMICILLGLIKMISYLLMDVTKALYRSDFSEGIILVIVGLVCLYQKAQLKTLIPSIIALAIIYSGLLKLEDAVDNRRLGKTSSGGYVFFAIIAVALGIVILFGLVKDEKFLFQFIGGSLIYCGVTDLVSSFLLASRFRKYSDEQAAREAAGETKPEEKQPEQPEPSEEPGPEQLEAPAEEEEAPRHIPNILADAEPVKPEETSAADAAQAEPAAPAENSSEVPAAEQEEKSDGGIEEK